MAQWYEAIHTTKRFRLGTIKTDVQDRKYIYAKGVASLAVRDMVQIDSTFATTRLLAASAVAAPVGVAMAANTAATTFSWFQIYGSAQVTTVSAVVVGTNLQATATAGQIDDTAVATDTIIGCVAQSVGGVGAAATAWLNYPFFEAAALV